MDRIQKKVENESACFMKHPEDVMEKYNFEVAQQGRLTLLRHECSFRADDDDTKYVPKHVPKDLNHILVVDCLRLVFCQVRKVSSVTWRMSLENTAKKLGCGAVRLLGSYSNREKRAIMRDYTKAIFVREPIERLVSAWRNKFKRGKSYQIVYGPLIVGKYRRQPLSDDRTSRKHYDKSDDLNITFKEFASFIIDPDVSVTTGADMHWQDVYTRCAPCDVKYNFIGHFETRSIDAQMLFKKIGAEVPLAFQKNHTSETLGVLLRELRNFPTEMVMKLYTKYFVDYRLFGYPRPNFTQV
ncbi:carbohydrate sulfotransferase 14-like isoform X2 [Antedon mediterranea]